MIWHRIGAKSSHEAMVPHFTYVYTGRCRYNSVNFLKNVNRRHPIARQFGRGMGYLLWNRNLIDILPQFLQPLMQCLSILDRVIMTAHYITLTSWWVRWRLKRPALRLFTQSFKTQIKENIKAPRHWPLCGEFTGDRWIPRTNGQLRGKCFHLMTSSWYCVYALPGAWITMLNSIRKGQEYVYGKREYKVLAKNKTTIFETWRFSDPASDWISA